MPLALRPITRDNLWAVIDLKLHPDQEAFVEDNVASIANAYVEPTFVPLAVYAGNELVGFAMYGQHPVTGAWWVIRHMIDREHQGKGLGRAAMEAIIAMMAERVGCEEIRNQLCPVELRRVRTLMPRSGFVLLGRLRTASRWFDSGSPIVEQIGIINGRPPRDFMARPASCAVALIPWTGEDGASHETACSGYDIMLPGFPDARDRYRDPHPMPATVRFYAGMNSRLRGSPTPRCP